MPANDKEDEKETRLRDEGTGVNERLKKNKQGKKRSRGRFEPY